MKIAIIGAGTMGSRLALTCAIHGHDVFLVGRSHAAMRAARKAISQGESEIAGAALLPVNAPDWDSRLSYVPSSHKFESRVDLVLEAVSEDLQLKQAVLAQAEGWVGPTGIVASTTSGLPVDQIAKGCEKPSRVAVAHFANPPHLMPLVELVPGSYTSPEVMDVLEKFVVSLGKYAIRLKRDIAGHIFNRIQFAMLREAMALVRDEVASAADIDLVVKRGLALRLAEEGPLEKMDLAGLELVHQVSSYLFPEIDRSTSPSFLAEMLAEGCGGATTGKGFHSWSSASARKVIAARNAEVIRNLQRLRTTEKTQ